MKKNALLFFLSFFSIACSAQLQKCNTELIYETKNALNFSNSYTVLVKGDVDKLKLSQANYGVRINYQYGNLASITGSLANLMFLTNTNLITRMELVDNKMLQPMNDTMRLKNNINPIHAGLFPLSQGYDGSGVIMGIIDSGIDYNHPDFKDSLGKSRILNIWDQNFATSISSPSLNNYGREWDSSFFNTSSCPHTDILFYGHGTHVSGIAGGNGGQTGLYKGVAPKVEFIVVALNFYSRNPCIADAANYIYLKAAQLGKPCVINASIGDYYGSHDGKDLQTQLIEAMLTPSRLFVSSAGNAGQVPFHLGYNTTVDTNYTWINNANNSFDFDIYSDVTNFQNIHYSIGVNNPTNFSNLGNIGFKNYNTVLGNMVSDTIYSNGNRIGVIFTSADTFNGVYRLHTFVLPDSIGYLWRFEATGVGKFDSWNFNYVDGATANASQSQNIAFYKAPDLLKTMVSGFQCSDKIITVGNYTNMDHWPDCRDSISHFNPINPANQIAPSSSKGPTRDDRQKPDIAASGDNMISCAVLSLLPANLAAIPYLMGVDSLHILDGGTSSSSPVVAGLGALFLQKYPNTTNAIFKDAIQSCAKQDIFTGTALPNTTWGYGKLDGFAAINCLSINIDYPQNNTEEIVTVFPNPFSKELNFSFKNNLGQGVLLIVDALGRTVFSQKNNLDLTIKIPADQFSKGIYFYLFYLKNELVKRGKIIHE